MSYADLAPEPALEPKIPSLPVEKVQEKEAYYTATQFQLMWWKFRRHRLATIGTIVLGIFLSIMLFCEFMAPYGSQTRDSDNIWYHDQF